MSSGDMFKINDPIHGVIEFKDKLINDLIDTQELQRLRRIKQLGAVDFVYPGATHTRFAHSIGVAHLVYKTSRQLLEQKDNNVLMFEKLQNEGYLKHYSNIDQVVLASTVAALLHDIGHTPFSHTLEKYFFEGDHEKNAEKLIKNNTKVREKIVSAINDKILPDLKRQNDDYKIVDDIIAAIKHSKPEEITKMKSYPDDSGLYPISELISYQIDCDRLDYIQRDNYFCGTPHRVDIDYILKNATLSKTPAYDTYKIVFRENARHAIEHFLITRVFHYNQIINHKNCLATEAMLIEIINSFLGIERLNVEKIVQNSNNLLSFLMLDDYSFINSYLLKNNKSKEKTKHFLSRSIPQFLYESIKKLTPSEIAEKKEELASEKKIRSNCIITRNTVDKYSYDISDVDLIEVTSERSSRLPSDVRDIINTYWDTIFVLNKSGEVENIKRKSEILKDTRTIHKTFFFNKSLQEVAYEQ